MMKIKLKLADGTEKEVSAKTFYCKIGVEMFHFGVHRSVSHTGYDVSDIASGKRVMHIDSNLLLEFKGDHFAAAKRTMSDIVAKHGEARVASAIRGA